MTKKQQRLKIERGQEGTKEGKNKRNLNYALFLYGSSYTVHNITIQLKSWTAEN